MSLATPSKIRELQIKLYRKAKNEPGYRFYMLYDKIYREDILAHAYALARANKGAPGVDGQTFEQIESAGLAARGGSQCFSDDAWPISHPMSSNAREQFAPRVSLCAAKRSELFSAGSESSLDHSKRRMKSSIS